MDVSVLVLLTRWPFDGTRPLPNDENQYFKEYCDVQGGGFATWWFTQTEGKVRLTGDVLPWFDLNSPPGDLSGSQGSFRAETIAFLAADQNQFDPRISRPGAIDLLIVVADITPPQNWTVDDGHMSSVPGFIFQGVVTQTSRSHAFTTHEIGHALGLNHSFGDPAYKSSGIWGEYGHPYCIMSAESFGGRSATVDPQVIPSIGDLAGKGPGLNGATRFARGWASGVDFPLVPGANLAATINSLGSPPDSALNAKVINIVKSPTETFTVEFRSPVDDSDRSLPTPMLLISALKGSTADQTYPDRDCATYAHQIRASDPSPVVTGFGFSVKLVRVAEDARTALVHVTESQSPWSNWFPINRLLKLDPVVPICAVSRNPGTLDIFKVDHDGKVVWAFWPDLLVGWKTFAILPPERDFSQLAPVAAVGRRSDHLDVFITNTNGTISHCWWTDDDDGWRPWEEIDASRVFRQDRPVCVFSRAPGHLDLFRVGFNNTVWQAWFDEDSGWNPWSEINPQKTFSPDAYVTGMARGSGRINLFVIGEDYRIWWTDWQDGQPWQAWTSIGGNEQFLPMQPVACVSRIPNQVDVFAMGNDGTARTTFFVDGAASWNPWISLLTPAGTMFSPQAQVSAVARSSDRIDVFVTDISGHVWSTWWDEAGGWHPWIQVGSAPLVPNQQVTALSRFPGHIDLFHLGTDGTTWSAFWPASSGEVNPPAPQPVIYTINLAGNIVWHRHDGAWEGSGGVANIVWHRHDGVWEGDGGDGGYAWTTSDPMGSDWQLFRLVFGGGSGIIYAVTITGDVLWYKHTGRSDGTHSWSGPKTVAHGWQNVQQAFADREGHIYTIAYDGTLIWHNHPHFKAPTNPLTHATIMVDPGIPTGNGWQNFQHVFAAGGGIIYAVQTDGTLLEYSHEGYMTGTKLWRSATVGSGWNNFRVIVAAENNTIYAMQNDGNLLWYRHHGAKDGRYIWSGPKWTGSVSIWGDTISMMVS